MIFFVRRWSACSPACWRWWSPWGRALLPDPQLPHLIREGQLDLTGAGLLAAANYLGYLVGALDALFAREARQARLRLLVGLWACFGLTLASVWAEGFWPHALLRFGLGVASAWVLIMVTALSQRLAAESGRPGWARWCSPAPASG